MRRRDSRRSAAEPVTVRIGQVGAEGDGIGTLPDGSRVYVSFSLPGELVRTGPLTRRGDAWAGAAAEILTPSPERASPPCPHFGTCGGCTLQHWRDDAVAAWKASLLASALRRAGFAEAAAVSVSARTPPRSRRRMDLALRRSGSGVVVGLHRAHGTALVDILDCHVLDPALNTLIGQLRQMLGALGALRRQGSAVVNLLDRGPDLLLRTDVDLSLDDRVRLADFARVTGLVRLSWATHEDTAEPVCMLQPPTLACSGASIAPPPGAFLQPSTTGEAAIVASVLDGMPVQLPPKAQIAELYAGCGTLTFALARRAPVTAWEGDAAAVSALRAAVSAVGATGRIEPRARDLARQPLAARELAAFCAVVLDPPHSGAAPQVGAIAEAHVPRVIYVSCNPAALARDARALARAGYRLVGATAIDQFLWSARLESVSVFAASGIAC